MPPLLPLRHATRIGKLDGVDTSHWPEVAGANVLSDTGELVWHAGRVTTSAPRSASVAGRWQDAAFPWGRLTSTLPFSAATVHSLDGKPLAASTRLLVTYAGKYGNSGAVWNETRTSTSEAGTAPALIECGSLTLALHAKGVKSLEAQPLNGGGVAAGPPRKAVRAADGWVLQLQDATTWWVVRVGR
jgi:hypothetical protein